MRTSLHAPRSRTRSIAAATLGALALIGSLLVATPAQALNDTGTGGVFVPATGRILDTKSNIGGYNTPMPAKTWRTVTVAGVAGVPADGSVGAVSVVATVADISAQGQLFGRPNADEPTTMMGIYGGENKQNTSFSAVLAVNTDGTIQVQAETTSRLILDVQGYYTANTDGTAPGGFVPSNGKRIVDTRSGLGATKATVASGKSIDVQVTGTAGVPAGASGVIVNLIAVNTTDSVGYLTPYATGASRPANSFNYAGSVATSMQAQVQLSASGKITIYNANSTTNIVVDVQGYFTAAGQGGAVFTPGAGRAYDTRTGSRTPLGNNETRSIQIAGVAGVPVMGSGINAVVLTLTALKSTAGAGNATVWADGTTRPNTTSINFDETTIRTNTITVPLGANGKVALNNVADATNYVIDVQGWYTNTVTAAISCASPYSNGSTGSPLPSAPISCSISAPAAAASGQVLGYAVDGSAETVATLSESAGTAIPVTVPANGGYHEVSVEIRSASDEPVSSTLYSFTDGGAWADETLEPAVGDGTHAWTQAPLQVSPHGDVFPDDVQAQYTITAAVDASAPVWVSDTSPASDSVSVPSDVLTAGQTYYWSAAVTGSSVGRNTPVSRTVGPWSFVATDTALVPVCANLLKDTADRNGFTVSDDEWAQYCAGDNDYDANNPAASPSASTVQVKAATKSVTFTGWVGSAVGAFGMQHKGGVYYNGSKAWKWYHTCDTDDYGYGFTLQLTNCGTHTTAANSLVSYMTTRVSFLVRGFPASRTMSTHATVTKSGKTSWGNDIGY